MEGKFAGEVGPERMIAAGCREAVGRCAQCPVSGEVFDLIGRYLAELEKQGERKDARIEELNAKHAELLNRCSGQMTLEVLS